MVSDNQFVTIRECGEFRRDMHECIKEEIAVVEKRVQFEFSEIKGYIKILIAAIFGILAETTLAFLTIIIQ